VLLVMDGVYLFDRRGFAVRRLQLRCATRGWWLPPVEEEEHAETVGGIGPSDDEGARRARRRAQCSGIAIALPVRRPR
jgi:hypothetical protein